MEGKILQKNYLQRRNKKLGTVKDSPKSKKVQFQNKRANSDNTKKCNKRKQLINSLEAFNLITKGPSINKLFFKNDNISLKSESVPKSIKKGVKKYKSINIDKGKISIYNNMKFKTQNEINGKFSNNTVSNYNIDIVEKSKELKGSAKEFYPLNIENNLKKIKKPNFINKNCISNDRLIIYNNNISKPNPILEFYRPMEDNEIQKNVTQKFQSYHQDKKISKFSDYRIQKQFKEEDMNGSLDNINPDEFRDGKTNIELISNTSLQEEKSSSLSSDDEGKDNSIQKKMEINKIENKVNNSQSINSRVQSMNSKTKSIKLEKNSNKNINIYNNEIDENYFKNDITFFKSPRIYSNHTSNKSLKSDPKGDFNNFILNANDSINYNNLDNYNKNYFYEINKTMLKQFASINSNTDFDKENEEENELTEKLNKSNNFIDYSNKFQNNIIINDISNNLKMQENNRIDLNNENNLKNLNYINETNNNNDSLFNLNNNNKMVELMNNNINNYIQKNNQLNNLPSNNTKNIDTLNIINNNINNENINNNTLPFNNLVGNPNQSQIINIQNMNNFNNNNIILNPDNSTYNNLMQDYNNANVPQINSIKDQIQLIHNKNNIFNNQGYLRENINQNLYGYINNANQINEYNLNQILQAQQNNLINKNNYIEYKNLINNNFQINNPNYMSQNNIINNKGFNNLYNSNNIYNYNQQNDNIFNNNSNNINYSNYNNNNRNINNIYQQKNSYQNKAQRKKQEKSNYYQNNNNEQNKNIQNNIYYIMNNQSNNFTNLNNNINQNKRNINNNNNYYNNQFIPNDINYYSNSKNVSFYNNNNQNPNNFQIINGIPYLNNSNNINNINNLNRKGGINNQKRPNLNLLSNEDLSKQAHIFAKNQNGCRYLQKRVENNKELVPTLFFPNVLGHFQELSNDQFGNYYIKIIIKYLSNEMIHRLISLMYPSFLKIGTNQYGTKVLQYLIEFLNNEENLVLFIERILPYVVTFTKDLNGIHIIVKLLLIKSKHTQKILNEIYYNIEYISITREGSNFIIKKLLDIIDEQNLKILFNCINQKLNLIIVDQFGNYLIQNIILKYDLTFNYHIIENIIKNLVYFSNQKFSSNVVEKCFETEMKGKVIDEILKNNNFELMLLNDYGNYVIQKALNKADKNKQLLLLKALVPLVDKLQKKPFGQKLLQKLIISYPKLSIFILKC